MMSESTTTAQEAMQTDVTNRDRERNKKERQLKADTNFFCMSDHLADVWFAFKDDVTKLPAHKLLLSMRSEVFEAMFYGPLAESSEIITIEDIDVPTMRMVLRYIYSDSIPLDGKNVTGCLYAAKKYVLYDLAHKCTTFLTNAIDIENACTIYEQAKIYDEIGLGRRCIDFIACNSDEILPSNDFCSLSFESVLEITQNDNLSTDEPFIFAAVQMWGKSECKRKNLQVTPDNLRTCIGDILFNIRFPVMPIEIFAKKVVPTGLLTTEEMLTIYNHLAKTTEVQETATVGRYSSTKRNVMMRFDNLNLERHFQECTILLNSMANTIRLSSIQGDFVPQVENVTVSHSRAKVTFDTHDDKLDFCEPILLKLQSSVKISFQLKSANEKTTNKVSWSTNLNDSRIVKTSSIYFGLIPCTLKALVFKDI